MMMGLESILVRALIFIDLFWAFCQIAEIIVIGLHELPNHWHCEHHNQTDGGPNCKCVIFHVLIQTWTNNNRSACRVAWFLPFSCWFRWDGTRRRCFARFCLGLNLLAMGACIDCHRHFFLHRMSGAVWSTDFSSICWSALECRSKFLQCVSCYSAVGMVFVFPTIDEYVHLFPHVNHGKGVEQLMLTLFDTHGLDEWSVL